MSCHEPVKARGGFVSCAYCPDCRFRRSAIWAVRLQDERGQWDRASFLTLTISNEVSNEAKNAVKSDDDLPNPVRVQRRDLQLFFKRLRFVGARFKYYAVGEYGETGARAHYHILMFGLDRRDRVLIEAGWPFGRIDIGNFEPASVRYVVGYVMKAPLGRLRLHAERTKAFPPFSVMSRGIGSVGGVARYHTITTQGVIRTGAKSHPAPRYYVERLDPEGKAAFMAARRKRQLDAALARVDVGEQYVKNDVQDRAVVSRADFKARRKTRGTL